MHATLLVRAASAAARLTDGLLAEVAGGPDAELERRRREDRRALELAVERNERRASERRASHRLEDQAL